MNLNLAFIFFSVLFFLTGCEKKKYCIYGRLDLRAEYLLKHPTKDRIYFQLIYNYANPKNVLWDSENKKKLDSLLLKEGYTIDTTSFTQEGMFGYRFSISGNCQYCDYYKSIYQFNFCEEHE
jgi:hypothetical protein